MGFEKWVKKAKKDAQNANKKEIKVNYEDFGGNEKVLFDLRMLYEATKTNQRLVMATWILVLATIFIAMIR